MNNKKYTELDAVVITGFVVTTLFLLITNIVVLIERIIHNAT